MDIEHWNHVKWSETDHVSLGDRQGPGLSRGFDRDTANITSDFSQLVSPFYTLLRLCQDECLQRAGASVRNKALLLQRFTSSPFD